MMAMIIFTHLMKMIMDDNHDHTLHMLKISFPIVANLEKLDLTAGKICDSIFRGSPAHPPELTILV